MYALQVLQNFCRDKSGWPSTLIDDSDHIERARGNHHLFIRETYDKSDIKLKCFILMQNS